MAHAAAAAQLTDEEIRAKHPEVIAVDLDGTLAYYDHWRGAEHIGEPIKPMMDLVFQWLGQGKQVVIFTARLSDPQASVEPIRDWLEKHGLPRDLPITNVKDYRMSVVYDDRAIQVVPNTGMPLQNLYQLTRAFLDAMEEKGERNCPCWLLAATLKGVLKEYEPKEWAAGTTS